MKIDNKKSQIKETPSSDTPLTAQSGDGQRFEKDSTGDTTAVDSEAKYRTLFENLPHGVFYQSSNGSLSDVNPAALKMFGLTHEQFIGKDSYDPQWKVISETGEVLPPGQHPSMIALQTGKPVRGMVVGVFNPERDTVTWVRTNATPQFRSGEVVPYQVFVTMDDITDLKRAEVAGQQAAERLLLATQAGGVGIWELDIVNNLLIWDEQMFQLYGITPDTFGGTYEAWRAGLHPDDLARSEATLQMALRGEKDFDTEFRVVWPDGSVHYLHANARVHRDTMGRPKSLVGTNYDITGRKLAEDELKESEERLRQITENSPGVFYVHDRASARFIYVSPSYEKVWGRTCQELYDNPYSFIDAIHPQDRPSMLEAIRLELEEGKYIDSKYRIIQPQGNVRWVHSRNFPVVNEQGRVYRVIGIAEDITGLQEMDDALRETEGKLSAMLQSIGDHMSMMDKDLNIIWANETAERYFGKEITGRKCYEVYHQRQHPCEPYPCIAQQAFLDGVIHRHETTVIDIHGQTRFFECSANVALKDEHGKPVTVFEISRDITEQKKAEEALIESELMFRTMVEASPDIIWEIDTKGNFTYISSQCKVQLGYEPGDLIGQSFFSLIRPESVSPVRTAFLEHIQEKSSFSTLEVPAHDKEGNQIFIEIRSAPIIGSEGQLTGFRGIAHDITDHRKMQATLQESRHFVQHILDTTPDLIYIYDIREHRNIYTNREVANFLGYSSDEILSMGSRLFEIILHPDDAGRVAHHHAMLGSANEGEVLELEYRMKNADGRWRWLKSRDTTFARDRDGKVLQILGITNDITDQKNADEAVREVGAYTRSLIEASPDPLTTITVDGKISDVNAATEHATGYARHELIGKDFSDYFTDPKNARAGYRFVFEKGFVRDYPLEILHRDGHTTPVLYNATVYRDLSGSVKGVFAAARDVTYQKAAQEALRKSEQKFHDLSDLMPQTIFETDLKGRFTYVNRFALNLFGYDQRDLEQGLDISMMVVPEEVARAKQNLEGIVQGKKSGNEYRFRLKNGGTFTGISYLSLIEKDGHPEGLRGIIVDITERKRTEDILRLSHTILDCANRTVEVPSLLQEYVHTIQDYTGCEAVGILLLDEQGNIPHLAFSGFSSGLYSTENPFSGRSDECMCTRVIHGTTDPTQPFFSQGGSFYMNGTTKSPSTISEEANGCTWNVCNNTGYESVALVPIRQGDRIVGLIHLADRRENQVPFATVQVIEEIAGQIGSAIQRVAAEKQVRESLADKEVLLREIHHRVKNNLARVISLIGLQKAQLSGPEDIARFSDLESRIRSMSLVHESLYHSHSLSRINAQEYVKDLVQHLIQSYGPRGDISWNIRMGDTHLPIDAAIHCGLIITEIVTNSLKYAFPESWSCQDERGEGCNITLSMKEKGGFIILNASDNGRGIPPGTIVSGPRSLGLTLIRILAKNQLHGDLEIDTTRGTSFVLRFVPEPDREGDLYAG